MKTILMSFLLFLLVFILGVEVYLFLSKDTSNTKESPKEKVVLAENLSFLEKRALADYKTSITEDTACKNIILYQEKESTPDEKVYLLKDSCERVKEIDFILQQAETCFLKGSNDEESECLRKNLKEARILLKDNKAIVEEINSKEERQACKSLWGTKEIEKLDQALSGIQLLARVNMDAPYIKNDLEEISVDNLIFTRKPTCK